MKKLFLLPVLFAGLGLVAALAAATNPQPNLTLTGNSTVPATATLTIQSGGSLVVESGAIVSGLAGGGGGNSSWGNITGNFIDQVFSAGPAQLKLLGVAGGGNGTFLSYNSTTISANLGLYALLASPGFTGVPTAPTAANGTNTTQIATTAFVLANSGGGGNSSWGNITGTYSDQTFTGINGTLLGVNGTGHMASIVYNATTLTTDLAATYQPLNANLTALAANGSLYQAANGNLAALAANGSLYVTPANFTAGNLGAGTLGSTVLATNGVNGTILGNDTNQLATFHDVLAYTPPISVYGNGTSGNLYAYVFGDGLPFLAAGDTINATLTINGTVVAKGLYNHIFVNTSPDSVASIPVNNVMAWWHQAPNGPSSTIFIANPTSFAWYWNGTSYQTGNYSSHLTFNATQVAVQVGSIGYINEPPVVGNNTNYDTGWYANNGVWLASSAPISFPDGNIGEPSGFAPPPVGLAQEGYDKDASGGTIYHSQRLNFGGQTGTNGWGPWDMFIWDSAGTTHYPMIRIPNRNSTQPTTGIELNGQYNTSTSFEGINGISRADSSHQWHLLFFPSNSTGATYWSFSPDSLVLFNQGTGNATVAALDGNVQLMTGGSAQSNVRLNIANGGNITVNGTTDLSAKFGVNGTSNFTGAMTLGGNLLLAGGNISSNTGNIAINSGNAVFNGTVTTTSNFTANMAALGNASVTDAVTMINPTASNGTTNQNSPALHWAGTGWNGSASQASEFRIYNNVQTTAGQVDGQLKFEKQTNGGGWLTMMALRSYSGTNDLYISNGGLQVQIGYIQTLNGAITAAKSSIHATPTDGLILQNTAAATSGNQSEYSPRLRLHGTAWDASASETMDATIGLWPVAGSGTVSGNMSFSFSVNGAGYTTPMTLTSDGNLLLNAANSTVTLKTGTTAGNVTLSSGNATVTTAAITGNSVVVFGLSSASGAITQAPFMSAISDGVSFNVTAGVGDNSTYNWVIINRQ